MEYKIIKKKLTAAGFSLTENEIAFGYTLETSFPTAWGTSIQVHIQCIDYFSTKQITCEIEECLDAEHRYGILVPCPKLYATLTAIRHGHPVLELGNIQYLVDHTLELKEMNALLSTIAPHQPLTTPPELQQYRELGRQESVLCKEAGQLSRSDSRYPILLDQIATLLALQDQLRQAIDEHNRRDREERSTHLRQSIARIEAPAQPLRHQLAILRQCHKCQWESKCHDPVDCYLGLDID